MILLIGYSLFSYKQSQANKEALDILFDFINQQGEIKVILDNL